MSYSVLDRPSKIRALDPLDMLQHVMDVPYHCQDARYRVLGRPPRLKVSSIDHLLISGLGGSAIGGDTLRSYLSKTGSLPVTVNRDYEIPAWVSKKTLVICSSYSGNTEETISVFKKALAKRLPILVVSSGGFLLNAARKKKIPFCELPGGLQPRAALGYSFITLLTALETLGSIGPCEEDFQESLELMVRLSQRYGVMTPTSQNPAKQLARFFYGKIPVVYGGQGCLDSVAYRWKCQFNENAKQLALMSVIPEMNHNEVLGYSFAEPLTRKMAVVLLRNSQADHPQIKKRFDILKKLIRSKVFGIRQVEAEGKSVLAQMLSTIYLGDFVTVYLAYLKGLNPTPVALIDEFKNRLSRG